MGRALQSGSVGFPGFGVYSLAAVCHWLTLLGQGGPRPGLGTVLGERGAVLVVGVGTVQHS